jgi:signal transduction histidine kinase
MGSVPARPSAEEPSHRGAGLVDRSFSAAAATPSQSTPRGGKSGLRTPTSVLLAAAGGALATGLVVAAPGLQFGYRNPDLHVALLTAQVLIAMLCAYLLVGRLQRSAALSDLFLFLALATLAFANLFFAVLPAVLGEDTSVFSTWSALLGRLVGGTLFAAAALVPQRAVPRVARTTLIVALAAAGLLVAIAVLIGLMRSHLPPGIEPGVTPESSDDPWLQGHPAILALQLVGGTLFAAAAIGFTLRAERTGDRLVRWLAIGAVFAATSRVNYFLYPSIFTDYVYTGDFFRLLFFLAVLVAAATEIQGYWGSVRDAATLEERRRIAHDLHDGLAQELASVRRNLYWLDDRDGAVQRARASAERALAESRRAIVALTQPEDPPLDVALETLARDVGRRESTHVLLSLDGDFGPVRSRDRDALVRIASEAITNAARHGGAKVVRVEAYGGRQARVRIRDYGSGFDVDAARSKPGSYGLRAMSERAAAVGGRLRIVSAPGEGTLVEVEL